MGLVRTPNVNAGASGEHVSVIPQILVPPSHGPPLPSCALLFLDGLCAQALG